MNRKSIISVLLIAWLGHFCIDLMIGVWPVYKTMVGLDLAVAGMISAICALIGEGLQIVFGSLSDRGHMKKLIVGGLCAGAVGAMLGYTQDTFLLFGIYLLVCLGSSAFHPAASSLIGSLSEERKGVLITFFAVGGGLGMAFSQLIFTGVYDRFYGHTSLLAIPILLLASTIFFSSWSQSQVKQTGKMDLKSIFGLLRQKDIRALYCVQLLNNSLIWAYLFFLPDVLISRDYDYWIAFGGGHMVSMLGGSLMLIPAGYLADRFSCKWVILTAMTASIALLYAFLYMPTLDNTPLLALLALLGAALAISANVSIAFGQQLAPEHPGKVSALMMGLVWCFSEGIGQGGGGLLTKLFAEDAAAGSLRLLGCLLIVSLAIALKLPYKTAQKIEGVSVSP